MPRRGNEVLSLTGVRAFAAYGVLLTHFSGELVALFPSFSVLAPIYSRGGLGVDLFFVLSGFIISYVYGTTFLKEIGKNYWGYLRNRFARIYPNYFVTLTVLVLVVALAGVAGVTVRGDYPWNWLPAHYLMLQPVPGVPGGWNFPSWSIGAEFFAYIFVFPAFIWAIRVRTPTAWMAFAAVPSCLLLFWGPKLMGVWGSSEHLPMVTAEFLAGAFVWYACRASSLITSFLSKAIPLLFLCLFGTLALPIGWGWGTDRVLLVLLFPLILGGLATNSGVFARFLALPIVVYFGKTSYALYLVHAIVQKAMKVTLFDAAIASHSQSFRILVFALYLLLPLVAASVLFHLVEEPCRKWIRARSIFARRSG